MYNNISGVILAGGSNKRYGGITKSNIVLNGNTIISKITYILDSVFSELILVTNTPSEFSENVSCIIIPDIYKGVGPLGGIHAALKAASGDAVFVFAGDMPCLDKNLIEKQAEKYLEQKPGVLIPRIMQNIEPLHSIYSKSVIATLEEFLDSEQKRAVYEFLKHVDVSYFDIEDSVAAKKAFTNINSPSDIDFY